MNFLQNASLDRFQIEAFSRGLIAVAAADGIHFREIDLIKDFLRQAHTDTQQVGSLEPIGLQELENTLETPETKELFLKTALLLTWADNLLSTKEKSVVVAYAQAFGMADRLSELEQHVKEFLLGHLAHLQNIDALTQIARSFSLVEDISRFTSWA